MRSIKTVAGRVAEASDHLTKPRTRQVRLPTDRRDEQQVRRGASEQSASLQKTTRESNIWYRAIQQIAERRQGAVQRHRAYR
jgi:hypothetical protein